MPKVMKVCKNCGKEYEACHTPNPGIFRWRDVACSPECAQAYFHAVAVARGEIIDDEFQPNSKKAEPVKAEPIVEVEKPVEAKPEEPAIEARSAFSRNDESMPRFMRNRNK